MDGQLISVNHYWLKKLGYERREVLGRKSTEFLTESSKELAKKRNLIFLKQGAVRDIEYEFIACDGKVISVMLSAEVQYDESGQPVSAFAFMRDITEQKKNRQQIIFQNEKLKALNATKDKFLSIIAHDLRGPFNAIIGFSELLVNRIKNNKFEDLEKFGQLILRSANHSNALLSNLLDWAMTQTGQFSVSLEKFQVEAVINRVIDLLKITADSKNIAILTSFKDNTFVRADRQMVETVLRNLLSNAIKFTPDYGEVSITTQTLGGSLQICISDTGVGINEEGLSKLFKLDSNYISKGTNKETGTGFGLILCKELLEKQEGKISVSSKIDKGSTFTITLPRE